MKLFKLLLVSAAVFSSAAKAELNVYQSGPDIEMDDMKFVPMVSKASMIKEAARFAKAAYNDHKLVGLKESPLGNQVGFHHRDRLINEGYTVTSFNAKVPGKGYVPAGIVAYKDGKVIVSYHGSESRQDFTEVNLRSLKAKTSELGIEGYAHGGFMSRYLQSRGDLFELLEATLTAHGKTAQDVDFTVTGHSLGGALATLAATDLKKNLVKSGNLDLVTFSSPRVFDHKAADKMEDLLGKNHMIRIWRDKDVVPMVSLGTQILGGWFTGFKHVGESIKLDAVVNKPDLANHLMDSILTDIEKAEDINFDAHHVGYKTSLKGFFNKVTSKVKSFFGRA